MNYKQMWIEKYEEFIEDGELSEIECQEAADDYCSAYMYEKADYELNARREKALNRNSMGDL